MRLWMLMVESTPIADPWEAVKAFGIAGPLVGTLGLWLRLVLKERDAAQEKADRIEAQRLDELREILPLAHSLAAIAERIERRLE
jgi:hypothetical protein